MTNERRNSISSRVSDEKYSKLYDLRNHFELRTLDETISFLIDYVYEEVTRPQRYRLITQAHARKGSSILSSENFER